MGLREELVAITNRPYQPLFSGKLNTAYERRRELDRARPQTCPKPMSVSNTQLTSRATTAVTQKQHYTSQLSLTSTKKIDLIKLNETSCDDFDKVSVCTTNISLLSIESKKTLPEIKSYGNFKYFSYFERYMNRRMAVKIPTHLMPKITEAQATEIEPTIYELLHKDELNELFNLFNVIQPLPFRIRSLSIATELPSKIHDLENKKEQKKTNEKHLKRRISLPSVEIGYLKKVLHFSLDKSNQDSSDTQIQTNDLNDMVWKMRLKNDEHERSPSPKFNNEEIASPQIYQMGDAVFNKKLHKTLKAKSAKNKSIYYDVNDDINNLDHLKKPYSYVESKLTAYLKPSSSRTESTNGKMTFTNTTKSKVAVQRHYISSAPQVTYKNPNSMQESIKEKKRRLAKNCLRLSESLDNKIRDDLRINRGPVYFAQLNQENLDLFNEKKPFKLKDRFLFLYEWLEKLDEKECKHFYANPFKTDNSINTEPEPISSTSITNLKQISQTSNDAVSPSSPITGPVKESMNPLFNRKYKVDPFHNPKIQQTNCKLMRNLNANVNSKDKYIETIDKQALAVIKDYKSYLHLNTNNSSSPRLSVHTKPTELEDVLFKRQITKDKLRKTIATNEMTLARMKLDLFLF